MRLHQICVYVEGYQLVKPVTVDKVGIYFRHAYCMQHRVSFTDRRSLNIKVIRSSTFEIIAE